MTGAGGAGGSAEAAASDAGAIEARLSDTAVPPSPDAAQPLYIVAGTIFGTSEVTYVAPVRSLAAGTQIDYAKALEITGGAGVYGPERTGHFFVGSSESPTSQDGKSLPRVSSRRERRSASRITAFRTRS